MILSCSFFAVVFTLPAEVNAVTLYVGGSGPSNYTSIQDAIDAAYPGDIIHVYSGNYTEHLTIDKPITLIGENKTTTIVNGIGVQDVIQIKADWVNISGFTVKSNETAVGMKLDAVDNCTIENNVITHNKRGIYILYSTNTIVSGNDISHSSQSGVYAIQSNDNTYEANNLSFNRYGMMAYLSIGVRMFNNSVSDGTYGLTAVESDNITILNNMISVNVYGNYFYNSSNITVINNEILGNEYGLRFLLPSGVNVVHHNNFVDNSIQATDQGDNIWDDDYPFGGNYWSDYNGIDFYSGLSQDQPGGDGIGDTPYGITAGPSCDRYPLIYPVHPPPWRPSAPRGLVASAGDTKVLLTWAQPTTDGGSTIINYTIYRGTNKGDEIFLTELGNTLEFVDTGLTNGQRYYYMVSAKNAVGEGPKSNNANAIPATVPGKPTNLSAIGSDCNIVLNWFPPLDNGGFPVTNYSIYRGSTPGGETHLIDIGNVLSYVDIGLLNGQTYFYFIGAKNAIGEGPKSDEVNATPATTPTEPMNLIAIPGDGQVTLTWNVPTSNGGFRIINYSIFRGETSVNKNLLITIGNTTIYYDMGLVNGQTYFYQVSALNIIGEGPKSEEANATPVKHPSEPLNLQAFADDHQITLIWSMPISDGGSPITNYTIYRGTTSGGETNLTKIGNVLTYLDTGLTNGVTYYYKVSAINAIGEGPQSNEANATPTTLPGPPNGLVTSASNQQVTLNWLPPSDNGGSPITNYSIYRCLSPGGETFLTTIGNVTTHIDTSLMNGQTYYYKVSAWNSLGEGPRSNEANATPTKTPSEPLNLQAIAGSTQVTLIWSLPTDDGGLPITNYTIYRGLSSGSETLLTTLGNVLAHTDSGLINGQTYFYKVSAKNAIGEGQNSTEISATPSTIPSEPRNLQAFAGNSQITLIWTAPAFNGGSPIINYSIYQGSTSGGETFLKDVDNVLFCTIASLVNGETYFYRISAKNAAGEGPQSTEASATPVTVPGAPIGLSAIIGNEQITLMWLAPEDDGGFQITNYTIHRGITSDSKTFLITLGNVLTYTDTGLTSGVTYFYTVTAMNAVGYGPTSIEVSATSASTPWIPLNLQTSAFWNTTTGAGYILLTWTEPAENGGSPVSNYRIYRGTEPGREMLLANTLNVTLFKDITVLPGQIYYYRVSAINAFGEGPKSMDVSGLLEPDAPPPEDKSILEEPWFWTVAIFLFFMIVLMFLYILKRKMSKRIDEEIASVLEEDVEREKL